jgi:predicted esterase
MTAQSEPRERHLLVTRTARYWTIGEPSAALREVWLVCHGYGQLAHRFIRRFECLDNGTRLIVAPEALNRFYVDGGMGPHGPESRVGATWMTREDRLHEIEDYIRYIDAVRDRVLDGLDRDTVRLHAVGFSQGVATVCRWAARTNGRIDHLILWAGTLPPELEISTDMFGGARITFVIGEQDPFAATSVVDTLRDRITQSGLDCALIRFPGGHELNDDVLRQIASS